MRDPHAHTLPTSPLVPSPAIPPADLVLDRATQAFYDAFPYDSFCLPQTHPSRLGAIARLFGASQAKSMDGARVLEIGCASGGNLLPMAVHFPNSSFVGIDVSARQIADGNKRLEEFPVPNLSLKQANILELDESWLEDGPFDYIIAHGVYSWVPPKVQQHLLAAMSLLLAPAGLAYVSYNVNPGWRLRGAVRELVQYFSAKFQDPVERVRQSRALVDFLADSMRDDNDDPLAKVLRDESARMKGFPDYYILHEYFEPCNEAIYFHEFAARFNSAGLRYVGDARPATMATAGFSPDVEKGIRAISRDMIELEQFLDVLRSRSFRESILCRRDLVLDHSVTPDRLTGLYLSTSLSPLPHASAESTPVPNDFKWLTDTNKEITTTDPLANAALEVLVRAAPASVRFEDLVIHAARAISAQPTVALTHRVGAIMLGLIFGSTDVVELLTSPHPLVASPGPNPTACPLARFQARTQDEVPSRRHRMCKLSDEYLSLLHQCDGRSRDRIAAQDDDLVLLAKHGLLIENAS